MDNNIIVVDLEATCWQKGSAPKKMEIIEIGAVKLSRELEVIDEFAKFVRPVCELQLSEFCIDLTSITQQDVDDAETFKEVFPAFVDWAGENPYKISSWGAYDWKQFLVDCERHEIEFPYKEQQRLNLKELFAKQRKIKQCGMKWALQSLEIPLDGTHHRGIDDARNITKIAKIILKGEIEGDKSS